MVKIDEERHKKAMRMGIHFYISAMKKDRKTLDKIIRKVSTMDENDVYSFMYGIYLPTFTFTKMLVDRLGVKLDDFVDKQFKVLNEEVDLLDAVKFQANDHD